MMDGEIRSYFLSLGLDMITQDQAVDTQSPSMAAQANREVEPRVN